MRKLVLSLLLLSLVACSSSGDALETSTSVPAVPTSSGQSSGGVTTSTGSADQPSSTAVASSTAPPVDIASGQAIELFGDGSVLGINLPSVSYANSVLNSVKRYLDGEPFTLEALLLGDEYLSTTLPLSKNVTERLAEVEGTIGIKVISTIKGTAPDVKSIAYVCLLNGGAYTSLSPCSQG
jgi:hypothetical protein